MASIVCTLMPQFVGTSGYGYPDSEPLCCSEGYLSVNRGLISRSAAMIIPMAQLAAHLHLHHVLRSVVLLGVGFYQRYLSPHKGFSCAHKRLYGGTSCSEYFRLAVQHRDLSDSIPLFQKRLRACKGASLSLNASMPNQQRRRKKRDSCADYESSCFPLDDCDLCELGCDFGSDCDVLGDIGDFIDCSGCD